MSDPHDFIERFTRAANGTLYKLDPREPEPTPEMRERATNLFGPLWEDIPGADRDWLVDRIAQALATQDARTAARVREECARGLFEAIAHGDEEHRAWLKQAITDYFAGKPVAVIRALGRGK